MRARRMAPGIGLRGGGAPPRPIASPAKKAGLSYLVNENRLPSDPAPDAPSLPGFLGGPPDREISA
eukprot:1752610-Pyramimonas_sp.AAC.1